LSYAFILSTAIFFGTSAKVLHFCIAVVRSVRSVHFQFVSVNIFIIYSICLISVLQLTSVQKVELLKRAKKLNNVTNIINLELIFLKQLADYSRSLLLFPDFCDIAHVVQKISFSVFLLL
jgi:hypothetical protein